MGNLGQAYARLGQLDKAITLLEQASHEFGKWFGTARQFLRKWFESEHSMGSIAVSRILRSFDPEGAPSESAVARVMQRALSELGLLV